MTDILATSPINLGTENLPGESFAATARRVGSIAGMPVPAGASDATVLDTLAAAVASSSTNVYPTYAAADAATIPDGEYVQVIVDEEQDDAWTIYHVVAGELVYVGGLASADKVAFLAAGVGAQATTVGAAIRNWGVNVLDFIPVAKHAGIRAGTNTDDLTAYFQAAVLAATQAGPNVAALAVGEVYIPKGRYHINKVGIQSVVLRGETREGTVLRAHSAGTAADFMLDGMLAPNGVTTTTVGTGWAENLSIEGTLASAASSGRSGIRVYGGGNHPHKLDVRNCAVGIAVGLPIWATVANCYVKGCGTGFYTFHDSPGDNGTSTTFMNCWADTCTDYGYHITQLYYSSFISCVAQNCGTYEWFVEGNANGNSACYSLQLIGCATEHSGGNASVPFYIKKGRQITMHNPRIIGSPTTDFIVFDDSTGSITDFATVASPAVGKYSLNIINHSGGNGAIALMGDGEITIPAAAIPLVSELGPTVNNVRRLAVGGIFAGGFVSSPSALAASNHNYVVPLNASTVRLTPAGGGSSITGISMAAGGGAYDGQPLKLYNVSGVDDITLVNLSGSSAPGNAFDFPGGNLVLQPKESVQLWYDGLVQRWHYG